MKHVVDWLKGKVALIIPFSIGGGVMVFMFLSFFDYFEPYLYPLHLVQGKARNVNEHCIVGPYPRDGDLVRMKEKLGVTYVVSLLDDVNLPQEKALYIKEEKLCEKHHIRLLRYPLSYFSLDNPENSRTIDALLQFVREHPKDKFYIHCYLGKHRAGRVEILLHAPKEN